MKWGGWAGRSANGQRKSVHIISDSVSVSATHHRSVSLAASGRPFRPWWTSRDSRATNDVLRKSVKPMGYLYGVLHSMYGVRRRHSMMHRPLLLISRRLVGFWGNSGPPNDAARLTQPANFKPGPQRPTNSSGPRFM